MTQPVVLPDDTTWLRIEESSGIGASRRAATALAQRIGMPQQRRDELAIVVTELASNLVKHVGYGTLVLLPLPASMSPGVDIVSLDDGPGIKALRTAMSDGSSSSGTLGVGLGAVARLSNRCDVYTLRGTGTVLLASVRQGAGTELSPSAVLVRPITGESESGDGALITDDGQFRRVMLADGLGHGPLAARAAQQAIRACGDLPAATAPGTVLEQIHRALSGTRGAAAAVVRVELGTGAVRFAGAGNISSFLVAAERRTALLSDPGILGHQIRTVREVDAQASPGGALVMHSDGLSEKWTMDSYPNVLAYPAVLLAASLLRDAGTRRDDASVVVSHLP
jgi:anti-sigma regulatory factor (Ser/Thr protein kinase)